MRIGGAAGDSEDAGSGPSRRTSICSRRSMRSCVSVTKDTDGSGVETEYESLDGDESCTDVDMISFKGKGKKTLTQGGFKGQMMKSKISAVIEGLNRCCWKTIQEDTGSVISSSDFFEQDISMLRRILTLETCSVPEITLFRACNEWAERYCRKNGLVINEENKTTVLGQQTLHLIRFPCMTVDEFQWEVVPTGILPYEDVQSLLHSMTSRMTSFGSEYISNPRSNKTLRDKSQGPDMGDTFAEPGRPVYTCIEDDPLDCMLGAELLRAFLKQTVDGQAKRMPGGSNVSEPPSSPSASRARLPPLTPRGTKGDPVPPTSPRPAGAAQPRKAQYEMVMGSRIDMEESQDGIVVQGGGRRAFPNDFHRLAPGFYRFRDESLIEIWLRDGEAMVTNHGIAALSGTSSMQPLDVASARARFNVPVGRAEAKGGVPLVSFLCRQ